MIGGLFVADYLMWLFVLFNFGLVFCCLFVFGLLILVGLFDLDV